VAHETLRDRARAMAQLRAIWHCEIFDTTPASTDELGVDYLLINYLLDITDNMRHERCASDASSDAQTKVTNAIHVVCCAITRL